MCFSLARRLSEMVAVRPEASSVVEEKRFFFFHLRPHTLDHMVGM